MKKRSRKRSSINITLALIGTIAIGCGQSGYRQMYNSREDCLADWNKPEKCEMAPQGSSAHYYPGRFYGPFVSQSDFSQSTTSRAVGKTSVTRGGFGSTSSFHSSGG